MRELDAQSSGKVHINTVERVEGAQREARLEPAAGAAEDVMKKQESKWVSGDAFVEECWKVRGGLQLIADEIDRLHHVIDELESKNRKRHATAPRASGAQQKGEE